MTLLQQRKELQLMLQRTNLIWLLGTMLVVRIIAMVLLPLADTTEPRYAEIARAMVTTNDWITHGLNPECLFGASRPYLSGLKLLPLNYLASMNSLLVYLHCWPF